MPGDRQPQLGYGRLTRTPQSAGSALRYPPENCIFKKGRKKAIGYPHAADIGQKAERLWGAVLVHDVSVLFWCQSTPGARWDACGHSAHVGAQGCATLQRGTVLIWGHPCTLGHSSHGNSHCSERYMALSVEQGHPRTITVCPGEPHLLLLV